MRIKEIITKGELRPVLKQFLPTTGSTVRNALGLIRRICMLILGSKGLRGCDNGDFLLKKCMVRIRNAYRCL